MSKEILNNKFKDFEKNLSTANMGRDILLIQGLFILAFIVTALIIYFVVVQSTSNPEQALTTTNQTSQNLLPYLWVMMNIVVIAVTHKTYKNARKFKKEILDMYKEEVKQ